MVRITLVRDQIEAQLRVDEVGTTLLWQIRISLHRGRPTFNSEPATGMPSISPALLRLAATLTADPRSIAVADGTEHAVVDWWVLVVPRDPRRLYRVQTDH